MVQRRLIQQGFSPQQVDAMPVGQAVLLYTRLTYDELRDQTYRWSYLPYWQVRDQLRTAEGMLRDTSRKREVIPLAGWLTPAVAAARRAAVRCDREIAVQRLIELLRMYAAEHGGRLPERLGDLPVPAPIDPVTGGAFGYQLRKGAAVISGPPLPGQPLNVEVRMKKGG